MSGYRVVFENEHVLMVDKDAGVLSVPGRGEPRPSVKSQLQALNPAIRVVHRLDLDVSGLMVFAKSHRSHVIFQKCFEEHLVQKTYEGWVEAHEKYGANETWKSKIAKGKKRAFEAEHGKESITDVLAKGAWSHFGLSGTRLWLQPKTGRWHQLRFECYRHGTPILGDQLYGSKVEFVPHAIALRARKLDFSACESLVGEFGVPNVTEVEDLESYFNRTQTSLAK